MRELAHGGYPIIIAHYPITLRIAFYPIIIAHYAISLRIAPYPTDVPRRQLCDVRYGASAYGAYGAYGVYGAYGAYGCGTALAYAMSGTAIAYAAMRCPVLRQRMLLRVRESRVRKKAVRITCG
eukprot:2770837-Rhodomonas_salina.1